MSPKDAAFASFENKWLDANPEQATVAVFLATDERRRAGVFGSLVHELEQAAFNLQEPQVAAVKLNWWRQELLSAATVTSRHPIACELFGDARAKSVGGPLWSALIDGALAQLEAPVVSSFAEAVTTLAAFYGPVAMLESTLVAGRVAAVDPNSQLWISSHLLRSAGNPERERLLPLDLLARHGLNRSELGEPGPRRTALLRDLAATLRAQIATALAAAVQASLGRRVRARLDLDLASAAVRATDPAAVLADRSRAQRWRTLWITWREARRQTR